MKINTKIRNDRGDVVLIFVKNCYSCRCLHLWLTGSISCNWKLIQPTVFTSDLMTFILCIFLLLQLLYNNGSYSQHFYIMKIRIKFSNLCYNIIAETNRNIYLPNNIKKMRWYSNCFILIVFLSTPIIWPSCYFHFYLFHIFWKKCKAILNYGP